MVVAITKKEIVQVPDDVTVTIKSKVVTVKGTKGELIKSFRHCPVQIIPRSNEEGKVTAIEVRIWFAKNKPKSCVNTIKKLLNNMINGVTKGYVYVMKFGYKIFRMQPVAENNGKDLKILKFLGDSCVRKIKAVEGCKISVSNDTTKKEIYVEGCDPAAIGQTCS